MRIAHISDIHSTTSSSFQTRLHSLLQSVRNHRTDHLIITGDLTDKATAEEYDTVIRLLREYDFTSGKDITVIPGNHDLYPSVYQSFTFRLSTLRQEFRREPVRVSKELYRVLRAYRKFSSEQYRHALQYFTERFRFTFENAVATGDERTSGFPYIKHLNDNYAALLLDSNYVSPHIKLPLPFALLKYSITKDMYSATDNPICSNGWVDTGLLRRALNHQLLEGKKVIVLLHHYLYSSGEEGRFMKPSFARMMSLVNKHEVIDELRESHADFILHGHWHITEEYTICRGAFPAFNGAGVFQKNDGRWNLLELSPDNVTRRMITPL